MSSVIIYHSSSSRAAAVYEFLKGIAQQLLLLSPADVATLCEELGRMHAVMPILDPTGYRDLLPTVDGHERMVSALARCHAELTRLVEVEGARRR